MAVKSINAYLVDAPNVIVSRLMKPLCDVPKMSWGSKATDDSNFMFSETEYCDFLVKEPSAKKYIKQFMMGYEFINNVKRYCLWLVDAEPSEIKKMPYVVERIEAVRTFREKSTKEATRKKANTPMLFDEVHQPSTKYIAFPKVSSERRDYVPIGFLSPDVIAGDKLFIIPDATNYEFGILTSRIHMAWMRYTCGRLKSDYSYSNTIVYNNFPWPQPNNEQRFEIEKAAQDILDVRLKYPKSSLSDLYDPDLMPSELLKAHQKLDRVVEKAYGKLFSDDTERVAFLFEEYRMLTEGLFEKNEKK